MMLPIPAVFAHLLFRYQGSAGFLQPRPWRGQYLGDTFHPSLTLHALHAPHAHRTGGRRSVLQPAQPATLGEGRGAGGAVHHLAGALRQPQLPQSQAGLPGLACRKTACTRHTPHGTRHTPHGTRHTPLNLEAGLRFGSAAYFFLDLLLTDWSSRCKQIMKMWRKISAADKVPFLVRRSFPCSFSIASGSVRAAWHR